MLLVRDFVAHMASEVVKRLVEGGQIEVKARDVVTTRVRQRMLEELTVEDRLNEEVRQILSSARMRCAAAVSPIRRCTKR